MKLLAKAAIFALVAGFSSTFFINWCDLIYRCGCTFLWAGAAARCNVHNAAGPHCPWCADGGSRGEIAYFVMLAAQAVPSFWPGRASWKRLAWALAASPAAAAAAGLAFGLSTGYWAQ